MNFNLAISILGILVVFALAVFGGHISAQRTGHKRLFWALGFLGVALGIVQTIRQQKSAQDFQAQVGDLKNASDRLQTLQAEIDRKQSEIKAKTEENIRLSDRITQLAETAINTATGGKGFCYLRMEVGEDGLYPVVLSKGRYPLYDLSLRLWNPEEWKPTTPSRNALLNKVAAETSQLGTLPRKDYIMLGRMPLPSGTEKQYAAEFSARNGSWSQSIVLRRSGKSWKVATIVQKSARVVKFKELNQARSVLCYEADPDFPEREAGELRRWVGHAQRCQER